MMNAAARALGPNKAGNHNSLTSWCASAATLLVAGVISIADPCIAHADSTNSVDSGAGDWVTTPQSAARLVTAVTGAGSLTELPVGLEITLQPGWKTYWRSPGDAGFPPDLKFEGSENVAAATLSYPTPHRFELFGLQTFGYKEQVVYPLAVTPQQAGAPVKLRAHLRYLVCAEVCIPYEADLALDIPAGAVTPTKAAPLISQFQAMVPGSGRGVGLALAEARIDADNNLVVSAVSDGQPFATPDLIVEGPSSLLFGKPAVAIADGGSRATLTVPVQRSGDTSQAAAGALTLTLTDRERGLESRVNLTALAPATLLSNSAVSAAPTQAPIPPAPSSLLLILGIAVLGGLILNVMPCVLPVLVLKLTSVLAHGGGEGEHVRLSFLATAAGIVSAFLALAISLVGLKLAGQEIGWGIQFQQPLFLGALAAICLVFAANLWGWFEVPLPAMAGDLALAADARVRPHRMLGAFLTGVFATVLATPCSAPFVTPAVAFALSRGPGEIMAIFLALALGMALPYLAVAAVPHLAVMLPRPGRWMLWLKRVLGLSMAATAAWLVWILAGEVGLLRAAPVGSAKAEIIHWQPFDRAAIPGLVAEGKTVFVDVTADWCLTCKANRSLVLDRAPVSDRLNGPNVVAMVADWTRPDPAISDYIASFNCYGVPMNVVYGPNASYGIHLPELLNATTVLQALKFASGS